jgi:hypothetical protein
VNLTAYPVVLIPLRLLRKRSRLRSGLLKASVQIEKMPPRRKRGPPLLN